MEQITILKELERDGYVVIPICGISMQPLLHEDSSHVLICKLNDRPKKYDVVLYVRPDGTQVLHRLMGYDGDVCLIRGDNTFSMERVPLSAVKGVMEKVWRKNHEISVKEVGYGCYVRFWHLIYPLRLFKHKLRQMMKRIHREKS